MLIRLMRKGLVFTIIVLFVGSYIIPSTATIAEEKTILSTFNGKTLYVGGYGPENYTKIQDAIDNAVDGNTVFVFDDSSPYVENLVIDKSIHLIGEDKNTTVIDGGGIGDVVNIITDWVNVSGFTIQHSEQGTGYDAGINLASNYCNITGNIFTDNDWCLDVRFSDHNLISGNIISSTNGGIHLVMSFNNTITDNTISNNYSGIFLSSSNGNIIFNNLLFNGGLSVLDSYQNVVSENIVNGKPLVYLEDESNKSIDDAGQIIIVKCEGITVQYQVLSGTSTGLQIRDSSKCYILGNTISDNFRGAAIADSDNIIFKNNIVTRNTYVGVGVYRDNGGTKISDNKISNGGTGLYICNCRNGVNIFNNIISNNNLGIDISGASSDCVVSGNEISNNNKGISLQSSNNNKISYNNFLNNKRNAFFYFFQSDPRYNNWNRNFWNQSRLLPKPIFGKIRIDKLGRQEIFWVNFDWRPAREPYDIP